VLLVMDKTSDETYVIKVFIWWDLCYKGIYLMRLMLSRYLSDEIYVIKVFIW
jgi:hypothetical protein